MYRQNLKSISFYNLEERLSHGKEALRLLLEPLVFDPVEQDGCASTVVLLCVLQRIEFLLLANVRCLREDRSNRQYPRLEHPFLPSHSPPHPATMSRSVPSLEKSESLLMVIHVGSGFR